MKTTGIENIIPALALLLALNSAHAAEPPTTAASLSREQVENIVRRSYQYVAMFNVNQNFALDPASGGMFMGGFNKPKAMTKLGGHGKNYMSSSLRM